MKLRQYNRLIDDSRRTHVGLHDSDTGSEGTVGEMKVSSADANFGLGAK